MNIPGLPEGVECVRIGRATPEEFEIVALVDGHYIRKGVRHDSTSQLIVRPEAGFEFAFDAAVGSFVVGKKFDPPLEITIPATRFLVTNSRDEQIVTHTATALMTLPGYQAP